MERNDDEERSRQEWNYPQPTNHAVDRFIERANFDNLAITVGDLEANELMLTDFYHDAIPIKGHDWDREDWDELRAHPPSGVVFVAYESEIMTVVPIRGRHVAREKYLQPCPDCELLYDVHGECPWCFLFEYDV